MVLPGIEWSHAAVRYYDPTRVARLLDKAESTVRSNAAAGRWGHAQNEVALRAKPARSGQNAYAIPADAVDRERAERLARLLATDARVERVQSADASETVTRLRGRIGDLQTALAQANEDKVAMAATISSQATTIERLTKSGEESLRSLTVPNDPGDVV